MKKDIEEKLDAIFSRHEAEKKQAEDTQAIAEQERRDFLEKFLEIRKTTIRPALEEIKSYLTKQGYQSAISESEEQESASRFGTSSPASIEIVLFLGGEHGSQRPRFSATCNKQVKNVSFHENTVWGSRGGHSGSVGESGLDEITDDLIQKKALSWLTQVFK